jgi:hypothetical protein
VPIDQNMRNALLASTAARAASFAVVAKGIGGEAILGRQGPMPGSPWVASLLSQGRLEVVHTLVSSPYICAPHVSAAVIHFDTAVGT